MNDWRCVWCIVVVERLICNLPVQTKYVTMANQKHEVEPAVTMVDGDMVCLTHALRSMEVITHRANWTV